MVILHIACITNNLFNGVCIAAPQHALAQGEYEDVAFLNINNEPVDSLRGSKIKQLKYSKPFQIHALPTPFDHPDLVIFHECYRPDYLFISKNLRKNNIPYIILPHGELGEKAQKKKKIKKIIANILLFNRFINNSLAIQCLSKTELEQTHFNAKKIIGTNGVMIPEKNKKRFSASSIKIVYVGRLDSYVKGLDLLISAASYIKDDLLKKNAIINIYGPDLNGRYAHVQDLILKAKMTKIIKLHHEVTGSEKESIILNSDLFIQTSRFEGMPLGILEALSYGIPCIITEGTNLKNDITQANAGWCAKNNANEIAKTIQQAINYTQSYRRMGLNGRKLIIQKYTWQVVSKNTLEKYKALLRGGN